MFGAVLFLSIVAYFIISFVNKYQYSEKQAQAAKLGEEIRVKNQDRYDLIKMQIAFPESSQVGEVETIRHSGGYAYVYTKNHIWVDDGNLCLFPKGITEKMGAFNFKYGTDCSIPPERYVVSKIPIEKIMFYREVGEVHTEVKGSGGHSSYSPITGFHGKINPVIISTEVKDNRSIQLFYDDGEKDGVIIFKHEDYYTLRKIIPNKDYEIVNKIVANSVTTPNDDIVSRMKKLKELYENELITSEEFEQRKKEMLDKI